MKRVGKLIEQIADIDNLYVAFIKACRGKQRKTEVLRFRSCFDHNIATLRQEILSGNVDVGHYHFFTIHDPKERLICAAPFRERVLHHAIMNVCHQYFDKRLIDSTYATRPGKGIYAALDYAIKAASRYEYLVKLDFRKYYDSIQHDVMKYKLAKMFKDPVLLNIFYRIIDSYHADTKVGLPIGNLTSQYFANTYLSDLDHKVKEQYRVPIYIRYMDDMLLAENDKGKLMSVVHSLEAYSYEKLSLTLKPPICHKSINGIPFLGYRILPYRYLLSGRSKRRFRSKLLDYDSKLKRGDWSEADYKEHILPLLSFVNHAESYSFRQSCLNITKW